MRCRSFVQSFVRLYIVTSGCKFIPRGCCARSKRRRRYRQRRTYFYRTIRWNSRVFRSQV